MSQCGCQAAKKKNKLAVENASHTPGHYIKFLSVKALRVFQTKIKKKTSLLKLQSVLDENADPKPSLFPTEKLNCSTSKQKKNSQSRMRKFSK